MATRETHDELVAQTRQMFRQFVEMVMSHSAGVWAELELSLPQVKILMLLTQDDTATVGQLAERLGVGQSTTSHVVDRLVQAQLVKRTEDPGDRRRVLVRLSATGKSFLGQLVGGPQMVGRWLSALSDDQLIALHAGMTALIAQAMAQAERDAE